MSKGHNRSFIGAAALAALVLLALSLGWACGGGDAEASSTVLTIITGEVSVQEDGADESRTAEDGEALARGDRIITGEDGRAVVTFFDGSTQLLEPGTSVLISELGSTGKGSLSVSLEQDVGSTWSSVLRPEGGDTQFEVTTPAAVGAVRDTLFRTTVDDDGTTEFWTRYGTVDVRAVDRELAVPANFSSTTQPGDPPGEPEPVDPGAAEVIFTIDTNAWAIVVDPLGQTAGIIPPGVPVNQIPLTLTTDWTMEPQIIGLRGLSEGDYRLYLLPKDGGGDYTLTMESKANGDTVSTEEFEGTIGDDETYRSDLEVVLDGDELTGATLTEPELTDEDPTKLIIVQKDVLDQIARQNALVPTDQFVFGDATPTPKPSGTPGPSGTVTPTPPGLTPRATGVLGATQTPKPGAPAPTPGPGDTPPPSTPRFTQGPNPTPTATPRPTRTATPTRAPTPTRTPQPTPVPTAVPTPVPTPTPVPLGIVSGQVVDAVSGNPIGGATVNILATGLSTQTNANGNFSIGGVPTGPKTLQTLAAGYIVQTQPQNVVGGPNAAVTIALSPVLNADEVRIVLTWGVDPADLDAHLSGPRCGFPARFHASYFDQNPVDYAQLDIDDTSSFGPETVTIRQSNGVWIAGEYVFWVHNFNGTPEFGASQALVTVFQGASQIAQFPVNQFPGASTTTADLWDVARITIDGAGRVVVDNGSGFLNGDATTQLLPNDPSRPSCPS